MLKLSTNKSSNAQINISISNRREVEVDMEKCKKRNTEHCTKSKQYDQLGALKNAKY